MTENNDGQVYDYDGLRRGSTKEATSKTCPSCGGTLVYDPETQKLKCSYCESTFAIDVDLTNVPQEIDFNSAEKNGNYNWGADKKRIVCKNCGAETIYDELALSNICPYCGSNQVMQESALGSLAPGGMIPFVISRAQADESFDSWLKGKLFAPSKAKNYSTHDKFNGVYLPFWTFDSDLKTRYTAEYGITRLSDDDGPDIIDWYKTQGNFEISYDDITVASSTQHNSDFLKGIQPYNTHEIVGYNPEFLSGFIAERYSIGLVDGFELAKEDMKEKAEDGISNDIIARTRADEVRNIRFNPEFSNVTYKYLILPVWISSFSYNGKSYNFMVNGQTGKVEGKAPVSPLRVTIFIILCLIVFAVLYYLFS